MEDVKFDLSAIDKTFTTYKVGDKVNATIVTESKDGYVVNIGGKKDGFIKVDDYEAQALKDYKQGNGIFIELNKNFRSARAVIDGVNNIFSTVMRADSGVD